MERLEAEARLEKSKKGARVYGEPGEISAPAAEVVTAEKPTAGSFYADVGKKTYGEFAAPPQEKIAEGQMGAFMAPYKGEAFKEITERFEAPEPPYPLVGHIMAATREAEIPGGKTALPTYDVVSGKVMEEVKPLNLAPAGEFLAGLVGTAESVVNPKAPSVWGAVWEQGKGETTEWLAEHPTYAAGNVVGEVATALAPVVVGKAKEAAAAARFGEEAVKVAPYAEIPKPPISKAEFDLIPKPWEKTITTVKVEEVPIELRQVGEPRLVPKSDMFNFIAQVDVEELKPHIDLGEMKFTHKGRGSMFTSAADSEGASWVEISKDDALLRGKATFGGDEIIHTKILEKPESVISREITLEYRPKPISDFFSEELGYAEPVVGKSPSQPPHQGARMRILEVRESVASEGTKGEGMKGSPTGGRAEVKEIIRSVQTKTEKESVRILPVGRDLSDVMAGAKIAGLEGALSLKGMPFASPKGAVKEISAEIMAPAHFPSPLKPVTIIDVKVAQEPKLKLEPAPKWKNDLEERLAPEKLLNFKPPPVVPIPDVKTVPDVDAELMPLVTPKAPQLQKATMKPPIFGIPTPAAPRAPPLKLPRATFGGGMKRGSPAGFFGAVWGKKFKPPDVEKFVLDLYPKFARRAKARGRGRR